VKNFQVLDYGVICMRLGNFRHLKDGGLSGLERGKFLRSSKVEILRT
jgi:hypothetical protein